MDVTNGLRGAAITRPRGRGDEERCIDSINRCAKLIVCFLRFAIMAVASYSRALIVSVRTRHSAESMAVTTELIFHPSTHPPSSPLWSPLDPIGIPQQLHLRLPVRRLDCDFPFSAKNNACLRPSIFHRFQYFLIHKFDPRADRSDGGARLLNACNRVTTIAATTSQTDVHQGKGRPIIKAFPSPCPLFIHHGGETEHRPPND